MANKTRFSRTALLTIGLVGFSAANVAQAFDFSPMKMMNPSRWFGGGRDHYRDYDYGGPWEGGGPGYGWGGPGYGYGGPYGGPGYGWGGGPGYGWGGGPGYGWGGGPGYGYGGPGYGYGGGGPGYGYGGPGYAPEPAPQGVAPGYEAPPSTYR
jgi:hypothetical protein